MIRPTTLVLFILAVVAGGVLFGIAFEVSALEERLAALNQEITDDRDANHVLRAEWSYLNQPERLDGLTRRYLELQPLEGGQFAEIVALPLRPVRDPALEPAPAETAPAQPPLAETPIVSAANAIPRLKPAAPRQPSRDIRLASQSVTPATPTNAVASDKAALDAALRAIFGNTASSAGGASR